MLRIEKRFFDGWKVSQKMPGNVLYISFINFKRMHIEDTARTTTLRLSIC